MKLQAADGEIAWSTWMGGEANLNDRGWAIALTPDGNLAVTGMKAQNQDLGDFWTFKLRAEDGEVLWQRALPGATNNPDERSGWVAACDNGDVVMANKTWTPAGSYDVVLHRYASSDGQTVWTQQFNSAPARSDEPRCMIRDAAGDLLVGGSSGGDYMVLKFDCVTGDLAWSAGYDGPPGWYDSVNCLVEGPWGVIAASGFSSGSNTSWDAVTIGLDPADGDSLWVERFDAGDAQSDEAKCMAVSAQGDLYVAGYGYSYATDSDLLSLRYHFETPVSVPGSGGPGLSLAATARPNPFRSSVRLSFRHPAAGVSGPEGAGARIGVFDSGGRRVRSLDGDAVEAGYRRATWDGRTDSGERCGAGMYWVRLEEAGVSGSIQLIRLP